jgi:hypothetical protein
MVMVVVVVMMVIRGSERRAGKHHQHQGSEENLFHGRNRSTKAQAAKEDWATRINKGNERARFRRPASNRSAKSNSLPLGDLARLPLVGVKKRVVVPGPAIGVN